MQFSVSRALSAIAVLLFVLTGSACHKKQVPVAAPVQPEPAPAVETRPAPGPAQPVAAPPASTAPPIQTTPAKDESKYQQNKPPEQQPPPKRVTRPSNPAPAVAPPAVTPPAAVPVTPPAEPPRLGDILTPEQERQYNAAIDQSVAHAQASLASLANRQLTKEQEATLSQVQNFIQQARETRQTDLAAAKSLAERAQVLAHDLVESLK